MADKNKEKEYSNDIVAQESMISKLVKSGLVAVGVTAVGKKSKGTKFQKYLDNEIIKNVATGATVLALSKDEEYNQDITALALISGISNGRKFLRHSVLSGDMELYKKVHSYAEKADSIYKNISLFSTNITEKIAETTKEAFIKNVQTLRDKDEKPEGTFGQGIEIVKLFGSTVKDVFMAPINNIVKYGFKEGIKTNLRNSYRTSTYNIYEKYFQNIDFARIEELSKKVEVLDSIDTNKPSNDSTFNFINNIIFNAENSEEINIEDLTPEMIQKFKKYNSIKKSTSFTDMLGRFTTYKESDGVVSMRLDRIISEEANFATGLNKLAKNFLESNDMNPDYASASAEQKEAIFIQYLRDNGFGEFVDEYYKNDKYFSYGDIHNSLSNKHIGELKDGMLEFFYEGKSASYIKTSKDSDYVEGLTNNELLKNFAFTNVVSISDDFTSIIDNTAFDGNLMTLNLLGMMEKNLVGGYKNPLARMIQTWNPFKMIQSEARTKNVIQNDYLGFSYNDSGFLLNGSRITEHVFEEALTDKIKAKHTFYKTSKSRAYKYDAKRTTIDVLSEDYSVLKENKKYDFSYSYLFNMYKEKGLKYTLSAYSHSFANPLGIRYGRKGLRFVKNDEGYYKEGNVINDIFDFLDKNPTFNKLRKRIPNVLNMDDLRKDNRKVEETLKEYVSALFNFHSVSESEDVVNELRMKSIKDIQHLLNDNIDNISDDKKIITATKIFATNASKIIASLGDENSKLTQQDIEKFNGLYDALMHNLDSKGQEVIEQMYNTMRNSTTSAGLIKGFMKKIVDGTESIDELKRLMLKPNSDNKELSMILEQTIDLFEDTLNAKRKVKAQLYSKANNSAKVVTNNLREYASRIDIENPKSIFNNAYEQMLGYEYSKIIRDNENDINDIFSQLNEMGYNAKKFQYGENKKSIFSTLTTLVGQTNERVELKNEFRSYEHFNRINDILLKYTGKDSLINYNLISAQEAVKSIKNISREETKTSSVIVEDTIKRHLESKSILESVRKFIFKNKTDYTNRSARLQVEINAKNRGRAVKALYNSKETSHTVEETTFGVAMKQVIAGFQNAAEVIGIERIPGRVLGDSWVEQYKSFFKYKYLPLAGLVVGGLAINSFSDMIVPDSVPIVGNGVFGVATRGYATARIGLQYGLKYTGALSVLRGLENSIPGLVENGLTHFFDPLMDPSEMIDVYFKGKPIEVKKNRNWFTAGRQSGEGEEFGQYRPHLLYTLGNPSSGIYSNKVEKFFRKDFLLTKYPWYILDPYKEEREAYDKFGLVHPKTEQLFKDIPIIGHLMSATIGEVIKPTQYIGEEEWRVGENLMINPNYDERNPYSPKYIEFEEPNRLSESIFEAIEDIKTLSGLPGYTLSKATELLFGATNPYQDKVVLSSLDKDTSYYRSYEKLQLGGMFGTTEAIRRLLDDGNGLGSIEMNPITQRIPEWLPPYFAKGNNPYTNLDFGEYILAGEDFEDAPINKGITEDLKQLRMLSMTAPRSSNFNQLKQIIEKNKSTLNQKNLAHYYESLSYAEKYGKRDYKNTYELMRNSEEIRVTIDKKISPAEFESNGKRYKLSSVENDFNELSKRYGRKKALRLTEQLNDTFKEGKTYTFKINKDAYSSVGTDSEGDFLKVHSEDISRSILKDDSEYKRTFNGPILGALGLYARKKVGYLGTIAPGTMAQEKIFGKRSVYDEWSAETVQSPYFRDWDSPISSFIEPYYNLSSNSFATFMNLNRSVNEIFMNSSADVNILGLASLAGAATMPINKILGRTTVSEEYDRETEIQDELEKIKLISGEKSFYNMTGKENLEQFKRMMNEQDAEYFEDLVNVSNESEREKILSSANPRMKKVLQTIWNRHSDLRGTAREYYIPEQNPRRIEVTDIGAYIGNVDETRNKLKAAYGYNYSKLDIKRQGVISSYRGGISESEGRFIANKMYRHYNAEPYVTSTIYPQGNINIVRS